jgi:hypothetical protein
MAAADRVTHEVAVTSAAGRVTGRSAAGDTAGALGFRIIVASNIGRQIVCREVAIASAAGRVTGRSAAGDTAGAHRSAVRVASGALGFPIIVASGIGRQTVCCGTLK